MTGTAIRVEAPARLHLGFLDLDGGLGRRFGSLGLTIEAFATRLTLTPAPAPRVAGTAELDRVPRLLARLGRSLPLPPLAVTVETAIPAHAGLGSGTQLGLALGVGAARMGGLDVGSREIAHLLERGARSGIGIGAFDRGGFLVDGGRGADGKAPPIVARLDFPPAWRVLLVLDATRAGLHGAGERQAFGTLPPFAPELAGHLCRVALMQLLPGLACADLDAVGRAVGEVQRRVGDHFAPAQGARFASPAVAEVLAWLEAQGVAGVGQSSWGPTGFALLAGEDDAQRLQRAASARFAPHHPGLRLVVTRGRNNGALVAPLS
jgi:beta-RFAP synthase